MFEKLIKSQKGFSLLEMIGVISIVGFSFVGLLSLALQSIQVQYANRHGLVSAMLAQEGIELVRNLRDAGWAVSAPLSSVLSSGSYIVDYKNGLVPMVDSNADSVLDLKDDKTKLFFNPRGYYEHNESTLLTDDSNYRRIINVVTATTGASSTITSVVRYSARGQNFDYVAETILYDWK